MSRHRGMWERLHSALRLGEPNHLAGGRSRQRRARSGHPEESPGAGPRVPATGLPMPQIPGVRAPVCLLPPDDQLDAGAVHVLRGES